MAQFVIICGIRINTDTISRYYAGTDRMTVFQFLNDPHPVSYAIPTTDVDRILSVGKTGNDTPSSVSWTARIFRGRPPRKGGR